MFQQVSLVVWCIRKCSKESISRFWRTEKQADLCTYLLVTDKQHSFCGWNCLCWLNESQVWRVPFNDSYFPNSVLRSKLNYEHEQQREKKFLRGWKGFLLTKEIKVFVSERVILSFHLHIEEFFPHNNQWQSFYLSSFLVQVHVENIGLYY